MMTTAMKTRLIRSLGSVAVVAALVVAALAIQMGISPNVAHANSVTCAGTTSQTKGNFTADVPSTSNGSGDFNCIDGIGSQGPAVEQIQDSLNHCFGQHLTEDSKYGNLTAAAMKFAQQQLGDPNVDGTYGPQTRSLGFRFWGFSGSRQACVVV
jgi:hypothetical protein